MPNAECSLFFLRLFFSAVTTSGQCEMMSVAWFLFLFTSSPAFSLALFFVSYSSLFLSRFLDQIYVNLSLRSPGVVLHYVLNRKHLFQ